MIVKITWEEILEIWSKHLWPDRSSVIESNSAMNYLGGIDMANMRFTPTFFGFICNGALVGVNSGHNCSNGYYRSRGLWVSPGYRGWGIGRELLLATVEQAEIESSTAIWSYPRKSSWTTYKAAGFTLTTDWQASETSEANAYCFQKF